MRTKDIQVGEVYAVTPYGESKFDRAPYRLVQGHVTAMGVKREYWSENEVYSSMRIDIKQQAKGFDIMLHLPDQVVFLSYP